MKHFLRRLKSLKRELKMSDSQTAKYLSVPRSTYMEWIRGTAVPPPERVQEIDERLRERMMELDREIAALRNYVGEC